MRTNQAINWKIREMYDNYPVTNVHSLTPRTWNTFPDKTTFVSNFLWIEQAEVEIDWLRLEVIDHAGQKLTILKKTTSADYFVFCDNGILSRMFTFFVILYTCDRIHHDVTLWICAQPLCSLDLIHANDVTSFSNSARAIPKSFGPLGFWVVPMQWMLRIVKVHVASSRLVVDGTFIHSLR